MNERKNRNRGKQGRGWKEREKQKQRKVKKNRQRRKKGKRLEKKKEEITPPTHHPPPTPVYSIHLLNLFCFFSPESEKRCTNKSTKRSPNTTFFNLNYLSYSSTPHRWSGHKWMAQRKARPLPCPSHCGPALGTHTAPPPSAPWRDSSYLRWVPCWPATMTGRWCPGAPAGIQWWENRHPTLEDSRRGPHSLRLVPESLALLWGLWVSLQGVVGVEEWTGWKKISHRTLAWWTAEDFIL